MATIQNDRDILLQAALIRFNPPQINPDNIPGYNSVVSNVGTLNNRVTDLEGSVNHLMNTSKVFFIRADALTFVGSSAGTTPATITLTAERGGIVGTMTWTVFAGIATLSGTGDSRSVAGTTVTGQSVTIRARITNDEGTHDAYVTLTRLGAIAAADKVNLTNQVVGTLASENVGGLGALALLNSINLNTQTTGKLNGATQVTNLGTLAYANTLAADQIGAGQLAAGVIYAGEINADNITAGTITGRTFRTAASGKRIEISQALHSITMRDSSGDVKVTLDPGSDTPALVSGSTSAGALNVNNYRSSVNPGLSKSPAADFFSQNGCALRLSGGSNRHATIIVKPVSSLPADRTEGGMIIYQGNLCICNGEHWYKSDGTYLG